MVLSIVPTGFLIFFPIHVNFSSSDLSPVHLGSTALCPLDRPFLADFSVCLSSFLSESIPTCSASFSLAVCSSSFCPPGAPHQWLTSVAGQRTVYVYVNDKTRPGINAVLKWRHPKSECCPHPFSAVNTHNNKSILIQICVLLCSYDLSWCLSVVRSRAKGVLYVPLSKTPLATFSLLVLIEVY